MLHPSYSDLMAAVNNNIEEGEEPVVQSRYSIVIATAKRARQIIAGAEPLVEDAEGKKPLSIAVEELYNGAVKILGEDEEITDVMVSAADEASAEETAEAEEPEEETVEE